MELSIGDFIEIYDAYYDNTVGNVPLKTIIKARGKIVALVEKRCLVKENKFRRVVSFDLECEFYRKLSPLEVELT